MKKVIISKRSRIMATRRRSDIWVSNNRVLNGGSRKVHGRNPNFETDETKLLISLWGDPKIQRTLITTHKKHPVIMRLAEKMREYGYHRTPEEINTRIKNLKCFYNRIKKDVETGILDAPTWKHYVAMDEIMTRPIFSVRPNEIPKPSPRYKMDDPDEEATGKEFPCSVTKNNQDELDIDDNGSDDDDESDFYDDHLFLTQEFDTDNSDKEVQSTSRMVTKTNNNQDNYVEIMEPLKQEPIDVDDDDDDLQKQRKVKDEMYPKLSSYLQCSTSMQSQPGNIITTIASSGDMNTSLSNALKLSQPIMFSNQQSNCMTNQQGKISLVPANFLLKPPHQQMQMRPQAQHILYNAGGMKMNNAPQTITSSSSGQMPMKVLLVNALQQNSTTSQGGMANIDQQQKQQTQHQQQNLNISAITALSNSAFNGGSNGNNNNNKSNNSLKLETTEKASRKTTGVFSLMKQLVQVQTENLEVSRQRLELEKQRLEFEKTIGERILNVLPMLFNQQQQQQQKQQQQQQQKPQPQPSEHAQQQQQKDEMSPISAQDDYMSGLLIPKREKED